MEFLEFPNRPVSQGWSDIALQFLKILASLAPVSYRPVSYIYKKRYTRSLVNTKGMGTKCVLIYDVSAALHSDLVGNSTHSATTLVEASFLIFTSQPNTASEQLS